MAGPSVPADPGWDEDPAWLDRDPMSAAEREAWLDRLCQLDDDPCDAPQEYWDPQSCAPPPGQDELTPAELAVLRDGVITRGKAELIVRLTLDLSDEEAKAVEAKILGRAGRLTPGGLRSALARAVMEAAPETAKQRRQTAARFARVERWAEDSGNAALMGRELPPDEVLACDQRICWRAGELKKAGLEGGMDELRARAYLDLLLGKDSRPRPDGPAAPAAGSDSRGSDSAAGDSGGSGAQQPPGAGPAGAAAGGFAGRVTLTVPLGGYGTWRLTTPGGGPDLLVAIDSLGTDPCQHQYQARGHDPGTRLRHLSQIRHATCTSPVCRRPAAQCDFEHNTPFETGGRTCLCNAGPRC